jgi:hypothetical protein
MPSLLEHLRFTEVLVVSAYTLSFALLESLTVFIILVAIGFIFPGWVIRDNWVANGAVIIVITALWVISYHYFSTIIPVFNNLLLSIIQLIKLSISDQSINILGFSFFLFIWVMGFVMLVIFAHRRVRRVKVAAGIRSLVDRLAILTIIYLTIDLISGIVIFFRLLVL